MARLLLTILALLSQLLIVDAAIFFTNVGETGLDDTSMISGTFYRKKINDTAISGNATYDESVFQTHITGGNFTYTISGLSPGDYDLTLGFAETYKGNCDVGARVFNVTYNGGQEFKNFVDVYSHVRCFTAYFITKTVATDTSGKIVLDFESSPGDDFPFISMIEVNDAFSTNMSSPAPMLFFRNAGNTDEDVSIVTGDTDVFFSDATTVVDAGSFGPLVFLTHRYGQSFSYKLEGFNSTLLYDVTVGFAEMYPPNCAKRARLMNVKMNGLDLAKNLDVFATVGCNTSLLLSKTVTPNKEGTFSIKFTAVMDSAMVSFIRVEENIVPPTLPGGSARSLLRAGNN